MRFASFGALSLLLYTACGGSSPAPEAKAPVAVTEVSLEAEAQAASEAPPGSDPSDENAALIEQARKASVLGSMSPEEMQAVLAPLGSSDVVESGLVGGVSGGGFGTLGTGYGGGGTGTAIGIGTIGTGGGSGVGAGLGSGRTGFGSGRASTPQPQVKLGMPVVQGALDVDIVRRILRSQLGAIRYCYAKEQVQAPKLAGEVRVAFTIAPDGEVVGANVASSTLQNGAVESCVLGRIGTMTFPTPKQGLVLVSVTMDFSPPPPAPPPPAPAAAPPTPAAAPPASSGGAP